MLWRTPKVKNNFKIRQLHMSWILRVQKANNFQKSAYSIMPSKWRTKNTLKFVHENVRLKPLSVCTVKVSLVFPHSLHANTLTVPYS
jgi:hypothetical protein